MRREHFGHAWLGMILLFCDLLLKLINHLNRLMPAYLKNKTWQQNYYQVRTSSMSFEMEFELICLNSLV